MKFNHGTPIKIVEVDQTVDSKELEAYFRVMQGIALSDGKCPMRGLGLHHKGWNLYTTDTVDHTD